LGGPAFKLPKYKANKPMSNQKIRVVYGPVIRESVLIDPSVSVSQSEKETVERSNIIATGASTSQLLKKRYGKR
jgi:hypothetical protein